MSSISGISQNVKSLSGVVSLTDGSGVVIQNGTIIANSMTVNQLLTILGNGIYVNGVNISPLILSYLSGLTGNIQTQLNGVGSSLLPLNNTWTGTQNFNANVNFNSTTNLTPSSVGLGNCNNTSDANKPVSTATSTALGAKLNQSKGSVLNYLDFANGGSSYPTYQDASNFGAITSNFSSGQAELSFLNNGYRNANIGGWNAFTWYLLTSSSTSTTLMNLVNNGNLSLLGGLTCTTGTFSGAITSPTITTINTNATTNATNITSNTSSIATLNTEMTTANTNITSNTSSITTLNSEVSTINTTLASTIQSITVGTVTVLGIECSVF